MKRRRGRAKTTSNGRESKCWCATWYAIKPDLGGARELFGAHSNGRGTSQRDGDRGQHAGFVQCRSALKCGLGSRPAFEFVLFWGGAVRSGPTRGASFNCQMAIKKKNLKILKTGNRRSIGRIIEGTSLRLKPRAE